MKSQKSFQKISAVPLSLLSWVLIMASSQAAHASFWDNLFGNDAQPPRQGQDLDLSQMTPEERIAIEEERLGRPLTAGEREVKLAMDKFIYQPRVSMPMRITKLSWTDADEIEFGQYVAAIGKAVSEKKCGTATACFRNPSINKFAPLDPPTFEIYTDCADLPYFLRAYFAYHKGLPFNFVTGTEMNMLPYASADDQQARLATSTTANSPYGNRITSRGASTVVANPGSEKNFPNYLTALINNISTATNRVGPLTPGAEQSDIFPVPLNRQGVRPGTIVAAAGHAMIVWQVNPKGEIRIIDGHPGSFIQEHLLVSSKIKMSRPDQGIGYYQFRPLSLVGAKQAKNGYFYGGKIVPASNDQLIAAGRYSLEQFFGPGSKVKWGDQVSTDAWKTAFPGSSAFVYLANNLRVKGAKSSVDSDIASKIDLLCSDIKDRMKNYADSQAAGVPNTPHPTELVQDVFGSADAAWEKFSTPGGDSRLRESVKDLVNNAVNEYNEAKAGSDFFVFNGSAKDYVTQLRKIVAQANVNCKIFYTNSAGKKVNLTINDIANRLNRLSFDPYMCAEKSWGASGAELQTCRDGDPGNKWYEAEKYLRNVIGKTDIEGNATIRSDRPITLEMLQDPSLVDLDSSSNINLGTRKNPVMGLDAVFASDLFLQKLTP